MMIDPTIWPALSSLLDEYLDQPEESRAAWLDRLGPEYAEVLPTLRELLARQTGNDEFLKTLPTLITPDPSSVPIDAQFFAAGAIVGPYKLNHELGRGGMGEVWLAERADGSLKRPVALKLPIVSVRNRAFAERFGRERDILAQLTHPQIARLYDAGVTAAGQSYLALEYVEGEPITDYCDGKRLGLKQRLMLFLDVLRAVQYAHTNLIVHRDLKPSNILVNRDGHVRLLDFGIAKLLVEGEAYETE